jgi:hypothetical protein
MKALSLILTLFITSITQAQVAPMPNVPSVCAKVWRQKLTDAIAKNMAQIDARLTAIENTNAKLSARLDALEQVEGPPAPPPVDPPPVVVPRSVIQDGDGSLIWIYQTEIDPIPNQGVMNEPVLRAAIEQMIPVGYTGQVVLDAENPWLTTPTIMQSKDAEFGKMIDFVHTLRPGAKVAIYGWPVTTCNEHDPAYHAAALASPITLAKSDWFCPSVYDDTIGNADDVPCVNKAVTFALSIANGKPVMPAVSHRTYPGLVLIPDAELTTHVAEVFVPVVNTDKADGVCFWHSDIDYPINAEIPAGVAKTTYLKWVVDRSTCLIEQAALGSTCTVPTKPVAVVPIPPVTTTKIDWIGAGGAANTVTLATGSGGSAIVTNTAISAAQMQDKTWTGSSVGAVKAFVLEGDGTHNATTRNLLLRNYDGRDYIEYGAYLGGGDRITIQDSSFNYKLESVQKETYGIRSAASNVALLNVKVDNSLGNKRSLRHFGGSIVVRDSAFKGGQVQFGDVGAATGTAVYGPVLVKNTTFEKVSDPMPACIAIYPGAMDVVMEDVALSGPGRSIDVDSRRTGNVLLRRVTWNGQPITKGSMGGELSRVTITN